ncbi:MAG: hypothetical protein ACFFA4_01385 [Promethearchaeota archaeon]
MTHNRKILIVLVLGIGLIIASIPIIFIIISNTKQDQKINISFTPKQMKSCPNHTAWLLLDISTKTSDLMSNLTFQINFNIFIKMKYEVWENSPQNKLIEIFLFPNITHIDNLIEIEAAVHSEGISKKEYAFVEVINWTMYISPEIIAMRNAFVNYLSKNQTRFKINETTQWEWLGNPPQILVVEHYLFKSIYWEMELNRHVMIAPDDWVKVYLRPRSSLFPNWSGRINSWSSGNHTVIEEDPPNEIFR